MCNIYGLIKENVSCAVGMCMECGERIWKARCRWPSRASTSARTTRTRFRTRPKPFVSTKSSSWRRYVEISVRMRVLRPVSCSVTKRFFSVLSARSALSSWAESRQNSRTRLKIWPSPKRNTLSWSRWPRPCERRLTSSRSEFFFIPGHYITVNQFKHECEGWAVGWLADHPDLIVHFHQWNTEEETSRNVLLCSYNGSPCSSVFFNVLQNILCSPKESHRVRTFLINTNPKSPRSPSSWHPLSHSLDVKSCCVCLPERRGGITNSVSAALAVSFVQMPSLNMHLAGGYTSPLQGTPHSVQSYLLAPYRIC